MASLYYPRPGNGGITRDSNRDGEDGERPAFGGLSEVILYVEDMDRLVSFYLRDHGVEVGEIRSPASGPRL